MQMEKWGIYARCSTEEQAIEGYSIEMQVVNGRKTISELPNAKLYKVYVDEGISGSDSLHKREQILNLINDIKNNELDGLWVYKADRLSRLTQDREYLVQMFLKHNINVISHSGEKLVDDSPQGEFIRRVLANIDELEVKTLAYRIKSAIDLKAEKGEWTGGIPPYGYYWDKKKQKMLLVNDEIKDQIKLIYHLYINELRGGYNIVRYLLKNNIPYYKNGKKEKWNYRRVYQALNTPIYCGYQYHNTRYRKFENANGTGKRNKKEWEIYPGNFIDPIITKEDWDKTREIRAKRAKRVLPKSSHTWLLTSMLYCGECGERMHGENTSYMSRTAKHGDIRRQYFRYSCVGARKFKTCDVKSIKRDYLENIIFKEVKATLKKYIKTYESEKEYNKVLEKYIGKKQINLNKIEKNIKSIDKKIKKYYHDYENNYIDVEVMSPAIKRLNKEKEENVNELNKLKKDVISHNKKLTKIKTQILEILQTTKKIENIRSLSKNDLQIIKSNLLKIVNKIYVHLDNENNLIVDITYNFLI